MQEGSREVLQRLLYHSYPEQFDSFLKFFEEQERNQLSSLPKNNAPLTLQLDSIETTLHQFHYSWFIDLCKQCPQTFLSHILSVFSESQASKLQKILKVKSVHKESSLFLSRYVAHWMLEKLGFDQLLPKSFYSHAKSFFLLNVPKSQLVHSIHKLGVLDLANMAKKVVDKRTLKELQKFLSKEQKRIFVEAQKTYNDPIPTKIRDLPKWLEDDRSFSTLIEKRGILRLSMALASENSFLVWHIAHILDRGRGQELLSLVRRCIPNQHTPYYHKQFMTFCEPFNKEKISP